MALTRAGMPWLLGGASLALAALIADRTSIQKEVAQHLHLHQWDNAPTDNNGTLAGGDAIELLICETELAVVLVQTYKRSRLDCLHAVPLVANLASPSGSREGVLDPALEEFERSILVDKSDRQVVLISGSHQEAGSALIPSCRHWYLARHTSEGGLLLGDNADMTAMDPVNYQNEDFCLPTGVTLRLDDSLFLPSVAMPASVAYTTTQLLMPALITIESSVSVCASISGALRSSSRSGDTLEPFTVTSGTLGHANLLAYWLDYCAIAVPNIHLWHQQQRNDTWRTNSISPCDVHSVTGLDSAALTQNVPQLDCIEDVFALISSRLAPSSHGHDSLSNNCTNEAFVFASALGWDGRVPSLQARLSMGAFASVHDPGDGDEFQIFLRVVRAFINHVAASRCTHRGGGGDAECENCIISLHVTSLWKGIMNSVFNEQRADIAVLTDSSQPVDLLRTSSFGYLQMLLAELGNHLSLIHGLKSADAAASWHATFLTHMTVKRNNSQCLDDYTIAMAKISCRKIMHSIFAHTDLQISRHPSLEQQSYFCQHASFREDVANAVDRAMSYGCQHCRAQAIGPSSGHILPFKCLHTQKLRGCDGNNDTSSCYKDFFSEGDLSATTSKYSAASSHMYVLAFVLPQQLLQAQEHVDELKRMCTTGVCHLYITYYLFPASAQEDIHGYSEPDSNSEIARGPSMRFAVLKAKEISETFARSADLMAILVGLDALLSFPGVSPDRGVLPSVTYGGDAFYRLPAPLIIASSARWNRQRVVQEKGVNCIPFSCLAPSAWESNAMVGNVISFSQLFRALNSGPAAADYALASDHHIRCAIIRYASLNPREVMLDVNEHFFNFSVANSSVFATRAVSTLFSSLSLAPAPDVADLAVLSSVARLQHIAPRQCILTEETFPIINNASHNLYKTRSIKEALQLSLYLSENCLSCYITHDNAASQQPCGLLPGTYFWEFARSAENLIAAGNIPLQSFREAAEFMRHHMKHRPAIDGVYQSSAAHISDFRTTIRTFAYGSLVSLDYTMGNYDGMMTAFTKSLNLEEFQSVRQDRLLWRHQRHHLRQSPSTGLPMTHYLTMASHMTENLRNLQIMANLAGIYLEILGLGNEWLGYSDKLKQFSHHLMNAPAIADDDVVVLIDAYDVQLFPAARRVGAILSQKATTPIVFCAENGVYPERASAGLYRRGVRAESLWQSISLEQRFLNSGCIVGRAGQMRAMLLEADAEGGAFQNDQQFFVRFALAHPALVSVDIEKNFFVTSYKLSPHLQLDLDLGIFLRYPGNALQQSPSPPTTFGIAHFNNMNSSNSYSVLLSQLIRVLNFCYYGNEGTALMEVALHLADGNFSAGVGILRSSHVQANFTSKGGTNCLGEYIMIKFASEMHVDVDEENQFRSGYKMCVEALNLLNIS